MFESIKTITQMVDAGKKVAYQSDSYRVVKAGDDYFIKCIHTNHMIKLVQPKTGKLNGNINDFFILPDMTLEEFKSCRKIIEPDTETIYYPDDYRINRSITGEYLVECSNWVKAFKSLGEAEKCLWEEWKDA